MQDNKHDLEVIRLVLQGNTSSYAVLVERYQHYVFTLVLRYIPSREEAEEAAQEVFIKAYKSLADYRGDSKFSTWLYTIVHTTCLSFLRKRKAPVVSIESTMAAHAITTPAGEGSSSERRSQKQLIHDLVQRLPETDAQIITLFYQHEQTLEEIGHILGMTPNNVKVRLFRARGKLKDILLKNYAGDVAHL